MLRRRALLTVLSILVIAIVAIAIHLNYLSTDQEDSLKSESTKTIEHFIAKGDSVSVRAARFLATNLFDRCYVNYILTDSSGADIDFDIAQCRGNAAGQAAMDSIGRLHPGLRYRVKSIVNDRDILTAKDMIRNIELAVEAWQTKPWSKNVSESDFLEYILPYRCSNEQITEFRTYFLEQYKNLAKELKDSTNIVEAAMRINRDVQDFIKYDSAFYMHPDDQSFTEMLRTQRGRCEDISNYVMFACRANGIPVTNDFVPTWANHSDNHTWAVLIGPKGEAISLDDGRDMKLSMDLDGSAAKVYRTTFSRQSTALATKLRRGESAPEYLQQALYKDVTTQYVPVGSVETRLSDSLAALYRFAYISVFSHGKWTPIDGVELQGKTARFQNIGTQVVYQFALYINNEVRPFGAPFLLKADGSCQMFDGTSAQSYSAPLQLTTSQWTPKGVVHKAVTFDKGNEYALFHWENSWKLLATKRANSDASRLTFENIPRNQLYCLVNKSRKGDQMVARIFTLSGQTQYWW